MFVISIGPYIIRVERGTLPAMYAEYRQHSKLLEEFDLMNADRPHFFISISQRTDWPQLVVAQTFSPSVAGFDPGVLLVPETKTLFIGAGERLLAYRLDPLQRLWIDQCDTGFWSWKQHGEFVVMSAELELGAWDCFGKKLWTTFVEPPWEYTVVGSQIHLDVMKCKSAFRLSDGPLRS